MGIENDHLFVNRIQFPDNRHASVVNVTRKTQLERLTNALGLDSQVPVIVLVGGAAGVDDSLAYLIKNITDVIAQAAESAHAVMIDGGTQSGVMAAIGASRHEGGYQFPLVGVAVERLVSWPDDPREEKIAPNKEKRAPLDPNHTHFVLVPGSKWGDESPWTTNLATVLSGGNPSLTILVNGGEISRLEVENSLAADRPVLVLKGSGRLADELAADPHSTLIKAISAEDGNAIVQTISELLKGGNSWPNQTPMKSG